MEMRVPVAFPYRAPSSKLNSPRLKTVGDLCMAVDEGFVDRRCNSIGRRSMQRVLLASAAAAGLVGVNSIAQAGTNATWVSTASGNWTTPSLWSTNPNYPNNDMPGGTTYNAVISATGSAYASTVSGNITIDSLLLNSASATLKHISGTLTAGNGLTLQAGTYALSGSGTIQNTTVNGSGGQFTASGGSLDGVTLNADLHLLNGASVTVLNSFTLNSTITFQGSLSSPTLLLSGLPTLTGTGAVVFDGFTNGTVKQTSGTLTIDSGLTFRTGARRNDRQFGLPVGCEWNDHCAVVGSGPAAGWNNGHEQRQPERTGRAAGGRQSD